jgi:hypothetical protein
MLKKHNKLIILLVLATFMFSIVGSAAAASFSDVKTTDSEASAIYKLTSLGVIEGYPDGTFGAEKTITRAEFAKIAVVTAGLKAVASGMQGTPSSFSDVSSDFWANGWINVAAAQGFVKGDGDGTFRPNDQITQAEVITVLLRILGYNDNLPGVWPANYISEAATLEILDDITFVASKPATRGEVAVMAAEALECNVQVYKASDNIFEDKQVNGQSVTLLTEKFKDSVTIEDAIINTYSLQNGKKALSGYYYDENDVWRSFSNYELTEDAVIAGVAAFNGLNERVVDLVLDKDNKIIFAATKDYGVVTAAADDVEVVSATRVKLGNVTYSYANNYVNALPAAVAAYFNTASTLNLEDRMINDGVTPVDSIRVALDEDGDIIHIKRNSWLYGTNPEPGIVDEVNLKNATIQFKNPGSVRMDADDPESYFVFRNGVPATLEDIEVDDIVWDFNAGAGARDIEHVIMAYGESYRVSGVLNSYEYDGTQLTKVVVDGTSYDVVADGKYFLSEDEGEDFTLVTTADSIEDILGEEVTLYLTPVKKVVGIASGAGESGKIYGVINDATVSTLVDGKITASIEVLRADGNFYTYAPDSDSKIQVGAAAAIPLVPATHINAAGFLDEDVFVEISLNSKGYIDVIKTQNVASIFTSFAIGDVLYADEDEQVLRHSDGVTTSSYDAKDLVVFNTVSPVVPSDEEEVEVIDTADFLKEADSAAGITLGSAAYAKIKEGKIQYLVINEGAVRGSTDNVAMVYKVARDADGDYVELMTTGDPVKYTVKGGVAGITKGNVLNYKFVGNEVENVNWAGYVASGATVAQISKISGNIIRVGATNYSVDADTLYFDSTETNPEVIVKGDLAVGDWVKVYQKTANDALAAIVVVKAPAALSNAKAITAFSFDGLVPAVSGVIDETAKTITVTVPNGTVVTALVPTITVSARATVAPASGVAQDFTNPVTYRVTAENGTFEDYTVTVIQDVAMTFDGTTDTITVVGLTGNAADYVILIGNDAYALTAAFTCDVSTLADGKVYEAKLYKTSDLTTAIKSLTFVKL